MGRPAALPVALALAAACAHAPYAPDGAEGAEGERRIRIAIASELPDVAFDDLRRSPSDAGRRAAGAGWGVVGGLFTCGRMADGCSGGGACAVVEAFLFAVCLPFGVVGGGVAGALGVPASRAPVARADAAACRAALAEHVDAAAVRLELAPVGADAARRAAPRVVTSLDGEAGEILELAVARVGLENAEADLVAPFAELRARLRGPDGVGEWRTARALGAAPRPLPALTADGGEALRDGVREALRGAATELAMQLLAPPLAGEMPAE